MRAAGPNSNPSPNPSWGGGRIRTVGSRPPVVEASALGKAERYTSIWGHGHPDVPPGRHHPSQQRGPAPLWGRPSAAHSAVGRCHSMPHPRRDRSYRRHVACDMWWFPFCCLTPPEMAPPFCSPGTNPLLWRALARHGAPQVVRVFRYSRRCPLPPPQTTESDGPATFRLPSETTRTPERPHCHVFGVTCCWLRSVVGGGGCASLWG